MKKTPIKETDAFDIIKLYLQGHTTLFISSQFDIPYSRVYAVLHEYNVPMRKRGGIRKAVQIVIEVQELAQGKYDHINFEPVAKGKNYADYLKQAGIKPNKRNWA